MELSILIPNQQKIGLLPVQELPVFSGNILDYPTFMQAFEAIIESETKNQIEKVPECRLNITRNHGHFETVNNCQRYIMLHSKAIKSDMAALIACSERKRVSYDVLHKLSTVDILYAENNKKRRLKVNCIGFYEAECVVARRDDAEVRRTHFKVKLLLI